MHRKQGLATTVRGWKVPTLMWLFSQPFATIPIVHALLASGVVVLVTACASVDPSSGAPRASDTVTASVAVSRAPVASQPHTVPAPVAQDGTWVIVSITFNEDMAIAVVKNTGDSTSTTLLTLRYESGAEYVGGANIVPPGKSLPVFMAPMNQIIPSGSATLKAGF